MSSFLSKATLALLAFHHGVSAHMEMSWPPPLRSKNNPFADGDVDYSMTSPLSASGSDFPCKGFLGLMGSSAASAVTTYQAGQSYNLTIEGGANHNGGSCQASLSFDGGETFTVIQSYHGGCPPSGTSTYDFTVPDDVPSADDAIFAWTWFNQIGNREMYMNCAVVSVEGGSASEGQSSTSFNSRPEIFVANVGNGCSTSEGTDVEFPNPGPDVQEEGSSFSSPQGSCGSSGGGGGSDGGNGGGNGGGNDDNNSDGGNDDDTGADDGSGSGDDQETNPGIPDPEEPNPGIPDETTNSDAAPAPTATDAAPEPEQPNPENPVSTTLPGGVFLPEPSEEAPAPEQPSTLTTVTTPAETGSVPEPTTAPEIPDTPDEGASGVMAPGTPCDSEGQWNCVGGAEFQRCASGVWSVLMAMSAGTSCEAGVSDTLVWVKKRGGARRFMS